MTTPIDLVRLGDLGAVVILKDVQGTSSFYGWARSVTPNKSQPVWLIAREVVSGEETDLEWASDLFDQVWDDRADLFATPVFSNDNSLRFRGSNNRLTHTAVTTELDFIAGTGAGFTISYWANSTKTGEQAIMSKQATANGQGWRTTLQSNQARFHISGGASGNRVELRTPTLSLADGSWHHVIWTINGDLTNGGAGGGAAGNFLCVVDGVDQTGSVSINSDNMINTAVTTADFQAGTRSTNALDTLGFVDEMSIWSTDLTLSEMQDVYNLGGTGKPGDLANAGPEQSFLDYWVRCGDNDTFPNLTNLGVTSNLDATMDNMIEADIIGDVP